METGISACSSIVGVCLFGAVPRGCEQGDKGEGKFGAGDEILSCEFCYLFSGNTGDEGGKARCWENGGLVYSWGVRETCWIYLGVCCVLRHQSSVAVVSLLGAIPVVVEGAGSGACDCKVTKQWGSLAGGKYWAMSNGRFARREKVASCST